MINMAAKLNKKHTVKISSYMNIKIKVLNCISKLQKHMERKIHHEMEFIIRM